MKRNNKLMKASGVLLVLTLITSCFVGGTLAKYVSEGEDSARVAKWGVKVDVTGDNAFAETYGKDDTNTDDDLGNTVISSSEEKVLAPGTKGSFGGYTGSSPNPALTITGTPEVAVNVKTDATVNLTNWSSNNTDPYCPLVFTIESQKGNETKTTKTICGLHYNNTSGGINSFKTAIEGAIEDALNGNYPAGTKLDNLKLYITWEWPFENSDHTECSTTSSDTSYHNYDQTDTNDTLLGNKAADNDSNNDPEIEIELNTTVTQID